MRFRFLLAMATAAATAMASSGRSTTGTTGTPSGAHRALRIRCNLPVRNRLRHQPARRLVAGVRGQPRLRRVPGGCARLGPLYAARGAEPAAERESAARRHGRRGEGRRGRGGVHPQAARRGETESGRLVVGYGDHGHLHRAERREGEPARSLRAALCDARGPADLRRGRLPQRAARAGAPARHPGRPRRGDQPTRLVRPVVRRQPRHPAAIRVPTLSIIAEWDQDTPFTWRRRSSRR